MLGELTLLDATFSIPTTRERRERFTERDLQWRVRFQSGTGMLVSMDFEPFDGLLTAVYTARPH